MKIQLLLILIMPFFGASVNAQQGLNISMAVSSFNRTTKSTENLSFTHYKETASGIFGVAYEFKNNKAVTISYSSFNTDISTTYIYNLPLRNSQMLEMQPQISAGMYTRKVFPRTEYLFAKVQGEVLYRFGKEGTWDYGTQRANDPALYNEIAETKFVYEYKLNPTYGLKIDATIGVDLKKFGTFEVGVIQIGGYHEPNDVEFVISKAWGTEYRGEISHSDKSAFLYENEFIARYTLNINRILPKKKTIEADKLN